jgi:restriction endonuclease S subunit
MSKKKVICPKYHCEKILSLTMKGVIERDLDAGGKMPSSFDGYQFVYPNNLLMCLFDYDVTPRCIGLVEQQGLVSPAYSQFVLNDGYYAPYYYYYYLLIDNTKELLHLAKNLRHSFTEEQLGNINVPVPPFEEQRQIADFLDQKCSEIDQTISEKQQQLETLAEYKKSLIYEYVTGKKEVA